MLFAINKHTHTDQNQWNGEGSKHVRGGYGLAEWRSKEEVVVPWASSLGHAAPWRRGRRVDGGVDGAGSRWGSGVGAAGDRKSVV